MRKYGRLLIIGIVTFFASIIPVFAKEFTVEQLEKEVEKNHPDAVDIYVIGKYAFTTDHTITSQDIMLASRSIDVVDKTGETNKDNVYQEMVMQHINRKMDINGKYDSWTIVNPKIGKTEKKLDNNDKLDIRYIDYEFYPEETKFNITTDLGDKKDYTDVLSKALKFEASEAYKDGKLTNENGKLKGLLLKDEKITLNADDKKKFDNPVYFFAYVLEIEGANSNTTIKVDGINGSGEILWKDFDVTPEKEGCEGKTPGIVVLVPVNPDKLKEKSMIEITIDLDGDKKEYSSSKYTFDLSELKFQEDSNVTLELNKATEADNNTMKEWNYKKEINKNLNLVDGSLTGSLVKQNLKDNVFKEKEGYYFDFTIVTPDGVSKENVKISHVDKEGKVLKEFKPSEFDDQNNLTILYQFSKTQKNCTDEKECKLYYIVDFDGDGKDYLPTTYSIDYSKLNFEKSSEVSISKVEEDSYEDEAWKGWDKPVNYETKFTEDKDNPFVVKVTGLIPIDKEAFKGHDDPFTDDTCGYYLAFKLTKNEGSSSDEVNVKFLQGDGHEDEPEVITNNDFGNGNELYVLKYINANDKNALKKKQFDVTVDFDGDGYEYVPYTITIDWSELDFQSESLYTDAKIASKDAVKGEDGYISETDKSQITDWGYDFEKAGENLALKESNGHYELTGKVKEQSVNAGFKGNDGYYVPIKIYGPTNEDVSESHYLTTEGNNKWTVELNTEDDKTKIVTPSDEEYKNGFITVLFKLKNDAEDQKITYKIDWDGAGNYFLPFEETIDYSSLDFLSRNTITYKYIDKNGKEKTETEIVYEGEQIPNKELNEEQSNYRKLAGWYNKDEKVELPKQSGEDEDLNLQAHWNLNVEKFINDVVEDLNNADSTYSDDFTGKFNLTQGATKNEIIINVDKPNVPLTELAKTSIPGVIAYVLEKGEINDITLTVGGQTLIKYTDKYIAETDKTYSDDSKRDLLTDKGKKLKEEIVKGAKDAFDKELSKHESDATLDQLEYNDKSFTIKIGDTDNTVTLVNDSGNNVTTDDDKTYTFKFDSDLVVVDQDDTMGAQNINDVLKKEYSIIYIDGDYSLEDTLALENKDVTILGVKSNQKDSSNVTLKADNKDTVIDVKSGTVTIKDLKITGGTKSELKVESDATVTVDNIDVSGIKKADGELSKPNAGIIVEGTLTASKVKSTDEKYDVPAIAILKDSEESETSAKVTTTDMTKNDRYYAIKRNEKLKFDSLQRFYGEFYYANNNNAQIYFMGIIDSKKDNGSPIDYYKTYYYDDLVDFTEFDYTAVGNPDKFKGFKNKDGGELITELKNKKAQEILTPQTMTTFYAEYEK